MEDSAMERWFKWLRWDQVVTDDLNPFAWVVAAIFWFLVCWRYGPGGAVVVYLKWTVGSGKKKKKNN